MYIDISMYQTDARKMYEKGYKLHIIKKEISYTDKYTGELSISDEVSTYRVYLPDVNWSLNKMLNHNLSGWGREIVIPLDGDSTAQTIYAP